jgi:hypothetical protein
LERNEKVAGRAVVGMIFSVKRGHFKRRRMTMYLTVDEKLPGKTDRLMILVIVGRRTEDTFEKPSMDTVKVGVLVWTVRDQFVNLQICGRIERRVVTSQVYKMEEMDVGRRQEQMKWR